MKIVAKFRQPHGSIITIRRGAEGRGAFGHPHWAERLVNGHPQQGWYGWSWPTIRGVTGEWLAFERKIGSARTSGGDLD